MRLKQFALLLSAVTWLWCVNAYGQTKDSVAKRSIMERIREISATESKASIEDVEADRAAIIQYKVLEQIKASMQKAKLYLRNGIDTAGIKAEINLIKRDMDVAGDGVFTNKGTAQTFRNLSVTSKIFAELYNKSNTRRIKLENYHDALNNFRFQLDSLSANPALFKFGRDSATAIKYFKQLVLVAREIHPIDSSLKIASDNVQTLLNDINTTNLSLQNNLDLVADYQRDMARNTFSRDFNNIWQDVGYSRPMAEIIKYSVKKDVLTLVFYLQDNSGKMLMLCALVLTSFTYLRSLKKIYTENGLITTDFKDQVVLRYPFWSAVVIIFNVFQFVFVSPPFLLCLIMWATSAVALSALFRGFIVRYWMLVWLGMVVLFLFASANNLILQASRIERWVMFFLSLTGFLTGAAVFRYGDKSKLREQWIVYSIGLMAALELLSLIANIFGRYNLSKSILMSGFLNVVIAIMFLWTVRLINEGLLLAFNVYHQQDKKLFYLNFNRIGTRAPVIFYILLAVGWCLLVGRNYPAFEYLAEPLSAFFANERTLGNYTFSINSILLFIAIITCAVVVSKIVSFFASDQHLHTDDKSGNSHGIGSWILLVRIAILTIGLFLAVAAAGIPVDRIAIILGALGVGIGFGLQTLVNNLVSGLIIAFEKPVNVGDRVDVDGQSGTMKSIGFRSSVISTWDGADVVMPNGDLLNSHLINWSLAGNKKRMFIAVGVAYDADLNKAKTLLQKIMDAEERLAKTPKYAIQFEQFGDSSIELRVYFWTKHISESAAVRSDLIVAINSSFSKNGITIPFPQQDVHLFSNNTGKSS